jgi:hypothetical protein
LVFLKFSTEPADVWALTEKSGLALTGLYTWMPLATTWNVPPAGPPPNITLSLANALPENAKVNTQIPIRMAKILFLMVTLLKILVGQYFGIMRP